MADTTAICIDCRVAPRRTDKTRPCTRCLDCDRAWMRLRSVQYCNRLTRQKSLQREIAKARQLLEKPPSRSRAAFRELAERAKQQQVSLYDQLPLSLQQEVDREWHRMLALPQNRNCTPMHRTQLLALATGIVAHGGRARISHRARILQQIRKKALNKLTHGSNTNLPRPPLPPPIPLSAKVMVSRAGRDRQLQPLP